MLTDLTTYAATDFAATPHTWSQSPKAKIWQEETDHQRTYSEPACAKTDTHGHPKTLPQAEHRAAADCVKTNVPEKGTQNVLSDVEAQRIASSWHGGGGTALYQFASSGAIAGSLIEEIDHTFNTTDPSTVDFTALDDLREYAEHHGPRPAVPDWYQRVICAQE